MVSRLLIFLLLSGVVQDPQAHALPVDERVTFSLQSSLLGEARTIHVDVPPGYDAGSDRYPVLVVLDAEVAFDHTVSAARFLARLGHIPPLIVVGVVNTERGRDMPVPRRYARGTQDAFLGFLTKELVPEIQQRYRTHPRTVLTGHSQGGLFAHYAFLHAPEMFDWVIALDSPLFGPVTTFMEEIVAAERPGRVVSVERTLGWREHFASMRTQEATAEVYQINIDREQESHQSMTYIGTYQGLRQLFYDYAPTDIETRNLEALTRLFADRSETYGYPIPISRSLVERNIDDLLFQVRTEEAEALIAYYEARFGAGDAAARFRARLQEVQAEGPLEETVQDLLETPPLSARRAADLMGTWEGRMVAADGHGVPVLMALVLWEEDGRLVGTTTLTYPDGIPRELANVMMRFTDAGAFEWGYMNQMRPRGVLVTTVRLEGQDTLRGTQEMRGIRIKFPKNHPPPSDWLVELHRKPSL